MIPKIIQLTSNNDLKSFLRQTPQGDGLWGNCQFELVNGRHQADWFIAFDEPHLDCQTNLPKSRRILFRTEPKTIKYYSSDFLNQFGTVVSIHKDSAFQGKTVISQVGLPWMYGLDFSKHENALQWNDLSTNQNHLPKGEISVVCSTKNMNINQSRRLRFLKLLKQSLGDRLTIYGRGFRPIADKREAIDGYRYHLVLENNLFEHGWTEKLADPILAGVFPISAGAPNISDYFNPQGFANIDITKPKQAVLNVLDILNEDPASTAQEAMNENKNRLLFHHNMFPLCCRIIEELEKEQGISAPQKLNSFYTFKHNIEPKWKRTFRIPRRFRKSSRALYLSLLERH